MRFDAAVVIATLTSTLYALPHPIKHTTTTTATTTTPARLDARATWPRFFYMPPGTPIVSKRGAHTQTTADSFTRETPTHDTVDEKKPDAPTQSTADAFLAAKRTQSTADELLAAFRTQPRADAFLAAKHTQMVTDALLAAKRTQTTADAFLAAKHTQMAADSPLAAEPTPDDVAIVDAHGHVIVIDDEDYIGSSSADEDNSAEARSTKQSSIVAAALNLTVDTSSGTKRGLHLPFEKCEVAGKIAKVFQNDDILKHVVTKCREIYPPPAFDSSENLVSRSDEEKPASNITTANNATTDAKLTDWKAFNRTAEHCGTARQLLREHVSAHGDDDAVTRALKHAVAACRKGHSTRLVTVPGGLLAPRDELEDFFHFACPKGSHFTGLDCCPKSSDIVCMRRSARDLSHEAENVYPPMVWDWMSNRDTVVPPLLNTSHLPKELEPGTVLERGELPLTMAQPCPALDMLPKLNPRFAEEPTAQFIQSKQREYVQKHCKDTLDKDQLVRDAVEYVHVTWFPGFSLLIGSNASNDSSNGRPQHNSNDTQHGSLKAEDPRSVAEGHKQALGLLAPTQTLDEIHAPDHTALTTSYHIMSQEERAEAAANCYTWDSSREPCYYPRPRESFAEFPGSEEIRGNHNLPVHTGGRHGHGSRDVTHQPIDKDEMEEEEVEKMFEKTLTEIRTGFEGPEIEASEDTQPTDKPPKWAKQVEDMMTDIKNAEEVEDDDDSPPEVCDGGTTGGGVEAGCPCRGFDCRKRDAAAAAAPTVPPMPHFPLEHSTPQPLPTATNAESGTKPDGVQPMWTETTLQQHPPQSTLPVAAPGLEKGESGFKTFTLHPRPTARLA